jgi:hypothetical protein
MLPDAPSWLLPAIGAIGSLIGLGLFLARMRRDEAAATVALILAVAIWNIARISIWSIIIAHDEYP